MGIFFMQYGQAQKVKVLDSITKTNIPYVTFKIGHTETALSDSVGIINLKNRHHATITASYLGYLPKSFPLPTKDTTILLAENIIRLGEVIIQNDKKGTSVVGNFQKRTNNVFVNSRTDKDISFTVVNEFKRENGHINSMLFYIFKDENYAKSKDLAPLEIVFFKADNKGMPHKEPFHSAMVSHYAIGWNKISLNDFITDDDIIFYGIRWIYNPTKYHYKNITRKKVYNFFGPKLGVVSNKNPNFHQTFFFNAEKGWRRDNFNPAMLALEITD